MDTLTPDPNDPADIDAEIEAEERAAAEAQAAEDAEVMAMLKEQAAARVAARKARIEAGEEQEPLEVVETEEGSYTRQAPMNRAERRAQVKLYASLLAATEKQTPVVNPTIIPKSKRRRRAGQKGRLQHA